MLPRPVASQSSAPTTSGSGKLGQWKLDQCRLDQRALDQRIQVREGERKSCGADNPHRHRIVLKIDHQLQELLHLPHLLLCRACRGDA
ncbi:hypothetical protein AOQ73_27640 [Bradyrhizobium pachyrhizi]|nr:hypothetical protein AOQ73_27640 [Bradyrhizobium pachyrhizi]